jgi:enoyl-CoA hydratase/carnithine racemase
MSMLEIIDHGCVREIRLARPPVNALSAAFTAALDDALAAAFAAGESGVDGAPRAIVLSGQPGMFSAGLDIREVTGSEGGLQALMLGFWRLQQRLVHGTLPVVSAITGHSPAGGAVLAILCDHRIMAAGDFRIGLNEVRVGLYPGEIIFRCLERLVGTGRAVSLLSRGAMLTPEEALTCGFVDEVVAPGEVVPRALALAQELAALPQQAYRRTRELTRRDLAALFEVSAEAETAALAAGWVTDETRAQMAAALARSSR